MQSLHTGLRRPQPAGVAAGAPRTRVRPPLHAWELVAQDMAQAELKLHTLLGSYADEISGAGSYLAEAGGKRIRPLLTALGARAVGVEGDMTRLMCVGELIHLGSLLHDDVVDDAATRRGRAAAQHVHGNALVILTGDFCLARGVLLASEEGGHACVSSLAEAVLAMSEGEVLQLRRAGSLKTTKQEYLDIIDRKSAALIAWCSAVGAHVLNDEEKAEAMEAFGRAVGVAFQITDDVLDYGGLQGETGKGIGKDLRDRKLTLPLLIALERDPGLRLALAEAPSDEDLPALVARVRETGALEQALTEARAWVDKSLKHLDVLPPSPHRSALEDLARYLADRVA